MRDSWRRGRLSDFATLDRSVVAPTRVPASTRYVGLENIASDGSVSSVEVGGAHLRSSKFTFSSQHVLYGKLRPYLMKTARPTFSGVCSTDILPILPGPDLQRDFLYYALRQPQMVALATARSDGVNLPRVSPTTVMGFLIAVPPIADQRRVVAILDKADEIRRKRQESLRLLDELLSSAFLEMFGDPVRNDKAWEIRPLAGVAQVDRGRFTPRPRNDPQFYGGDNPFIQTGDIAGAGGVLRTWRQTLNEKGTAVSRRFPKGTIAISIAANIGDSAIVDFDFYCPDSVVGIVPHQEVVNAEYLEACLQCFKPSLVARAPMTAQKNINLGVLRPLRIPIPSQQRQRAFQRVHHRVESLKARLAGALSDAGSLVESLACEAFRPDSHDH